MSLQHAQLPGEDYSYDGDFAEMWDAQTKTKTITYTQEQEVPEEFERFKDWADEIYGKFDKMVVRWYGKGQGTKVPNGSITMVLSFGAACELSITQKSDGVNKKMEIGDGGVIACVNHLHETYDLVILQKEKDERIIIFFVKDVDKKRSKVITPPSSQANGSYWALQEPEEEEDQYEIETTWDPNGHVASKYSIPSYHPDRDFSTGLPKGTNTTIHWIERQFFEQNMEKNWELEEPDEMKRKEMKKFGYDVLEWEETETGIEVSKATIKSTINGVTTYRRGKYILWKGDEGEDPPHVMDKMYTYMWEDVGIVFVYNGIAPIPKTGNIPGFYSNGIFMVL